MSSTPRTLFDKLWDAHVVVPETDAAPAVLYVDLHLIHEVTSPQAFTELRARGLAPRRPGPHQGHAGPFHADPAGRCRRQAALLHAEARETQVETLARNCAAVRHRAVRHGSRRSAASCT